MGIHEIRSSEDRVIRDGEFRRWGVYEMGSLADGKFTRSGVDEMGEFGRWGFHEMGSSRDWDCSRQRVQELSYKCLTRAVFCAAKAQDTKDAAKQRLSGLFT